MPKKVEVFAIGGSKCRLMEVAATAAIEDPGVDVQVEKVQDTVEQRERGECPAWR